MLPVLVVLFVVVPIAELYVIIQVGNAIGTLPTIAILIADSLLGSVLLRSQGRTAWRRFNDAMAAGRPPAREVLDGGLIIFGGALLLTPGFISDVAGLFLLLPPTRSLVRAALVRGLSRRFAVAVASRAGRPRAGRGRGDEESYDVEGTAVEVDRPALDR